MRIEFDYELMGYINVSVIADVDSINYYDRDKYENFEVDIIEFEHQGKELEPEGYFVEVSALGDSYYRSILEDVREQAIDKYLTNVAA